MASPFLSIVIPAYNEESRIQDTLERVMEYLGRQSYTWEVVVADDGSTDSTSALVRQAAERTYDNGTISLLDLPHGGKGWAVKGGMLKATGEYRFMCDADLSMSIEQVARFLPPERGDYDVAVGSREIPGARRIGEPPLRRVMARVSSLMVSLLAMRGLGDTQCGFKCFRGEAADHLFGQQRTHAFAFDVEVLFLARKRGFRIVHLPIDWHYSSDSKVRAVRDSLAMIRDLLRIRWSYLRGRYASSPYPAPERVR